jgi:hypothetical protein
MISSRGTGLLLVVMAATAPGCEHMPDFPAGETGPAGTETTEPECAAILKALMTAQALPRSAQFPVDANLHRLSVLPVAFREGDVTHETVGGQVIAIRLASGRDPLADEIRAALRHGQPVCELVEDGIHAGVLVAALRFNHPGISPQHNPTTLLIDPRTHLPLLLIYAHVHGVASSWRYGETQPPRVGPP